MIVVIGASGFIGAYLVDELINKKYKVLATGRSEAGKSFFKSKGVRFINLDITNSDDFNKLPKTNIEAVILLAALLPANVKGNSNPLEYARINIIGTLNTLEYCKKNNIRKIISTTSYADVQNIWKKDYKISENNARNYRLVGDHAPYVISKNCATDYILNYNEEYNMKGAIFRLPPVYGYGPHSEIYANGKYYKSGFQSFLEKAIKGDDIQIYGDKNVKRDIIYVKDVANAFIAAINSNRARGIYNIASGKSITLENQVKSIIKVFSPSDRKSKILLIKNRNNISTSYAFNITKAKTDFNFNPMYTFNKLLVDYKKEMQSKKFEFLVADRKKK